MSQLKVEVCLIDEILPHPNADRLEMAKVAGWMCVVQKGKFQAGDKCVYIPIDSVLSAATEVKIFPIDSKVKLTKSRIKTIKLRGAISQGLVVPLDLLGLANLPVGFDVAVALGITKYEAPTKDTPGHMNVGKKIKRANNSNFKKYTDIQNFKWYPELFKDQEVSVTEKIHGTNFRTGYVPFEADVWWKKVLAWCKLTPAHEFVYGSHNVQLQSRMFWKGYYDTNVYAKIVKQYNLTEKLQSNEVIYGEIYGSSIQKGYTYGCEAGEHKLVVFDLMVDGKYVSPDELNAFLARTGLPGSPELYRGPFNQETLLALTKGDSVLAPSQKVREGIVVKSLATEQQSYMGRPVLKMINDEYLLNDDNTDFH